jgi:hypothetical protein
MLREKYFDKISWYNLSENPCPEAMNILKDNEDKIDCCMLSSNTHSEAIKLLRDKNFDKIDWYRLSGNSCPEAIELLLQYPDKVVFEWLSTNPGIFERDYIKMSEMRTMIILEDFLKDVLHPRRIIKFLELGGDMDDYLIN